MSKLTEEKFKRLAEIDALVRRMRSSSVDSLSEDELITMMEAAIKALKAPVVDCGEEEQGE